MAEAHLHPFEVVLRACARTLSLSSKLQIDYGHLVQQMIRIAGASSYLLIHVKDIRHLAPLYASQDDNYWYTITDQIAGLFIDTDQLIDLYGSDIHFHLWESIKTLPIKIKDDKTGVIFELHDLDS